MNLPVLFRTRWLSQSRRKTKALTSLTLRSGDAEVMRTTAVHVSLSSKGFNRALPGLFCPHADAALPLRSGRGGQVFCLRQKPEVADGLWPCEAWRLRIADQRDLQLPGPQKWARSSVG
jgi:hypothetical protein